MPQINLEQFLRRINSLRLRAYVLIAQKKLRMNYSNWPNCKIEIPITLRKTITGENFFRMIER